MAKGLEFKDITQQIMKYIIMKKDISRGELLDKTLLVFRDSILPILLLLKIEVAFSEDKNVPDIYLENADNTGFYFKGIVPKNMDLRDLAHHIIHTLFMYMNEQIQRGEDKEANTWMKSVLKLNKDLFDINNHVPDEVRKFYSDADKIIDGVKKEDKTFRYLEEYNYKILSQKNNTQQLQQDIIQQLQQIINKLKPQ